MKKALMLLCLSLASFSYVAAQHVAQGKVVDADGNPIPGVKVEIDAYGTGWNVRTTV